MRLGFTGTRSVGGYESDIHDFLDQFIEKGTEFTTGACTGFDSIAARFFINAKPEATHRLIVPSNRRQIDANLLTVFGAWPTGWALVEYMPKTSDYRDRNVRILDYADKLIAVAEYPEDHGKSTRSGTWQTVRLARDRMPMSVKVLDNE